MKYVIRGGMNLKKLIACLLAGVLICLTGCTNSGKCGCNKGEEQHCTILLSARKSAARAGAREYYQFFKKQP
jgi:hypothetical protein